MIQALVKVTPGKVMIGFNKSSCCGEVLGIGTFFEHSSYGWRLGVIETVSGMESLLLSKEHEKIVEQAVVNKTTFNTYQYPENMLDKADFVPVYELMGNFSSLI